MCGIVGQCSFDGQFVSSQAIRSMTDSLWHRGPDGQGVWVEENIGLGHRRLSILDLSLNGSQPMLSDDSRYVLTYNGEIYNYKELRRQLQKEGICFRGNSDTEVVIKAFSKWKTEAFKLFNGMFALAIWDRVEKKLTIARDRYGIKPLYYINDGRTVFFASEQKAFFTCDSFKAKLNRDAFYDYFVFQNLLDEYTMFSGVRVLRPGTWIEFDVANRCERSQQYWDFDFSEPDNKSCELEYTEEFERLFNGAVERQLVSDVPVGSYLSGGIDSGSITAIASSHIENLKTFTVGFDVANISSPEKRFDERFSAELMSSTYGTEHYEMVLKASDIDSSLKSLAWHLEDPRVGQCYPNYYASKLASGFVTVVLAGVGGDELFAGYPWRYELAANSRTYDAFSVSLLQTWQRLTSEAERSKLLKPLGTSKDKVDLLSKINGVFGSRGIQVDNRESALNSVLYFEAKTFLHGLLTVEDRMSMAFGLETRVPFLDNDLVDFSLSCPVEFKIKTKSQDRLRVEKSVPSTSEGKYLLRRALKNYLPREIANSPKQGFSSPDESWFRSGLVASLENLFVEAEQPIFEYIDCVSCKSIYDAHKFKGENRRLFLWSVLNMNQFLKEYGL